MKYLGLDLGSRTLGIAISDISGTLARAYDTIRFTDDEYKFAAEKLVSICHEENINEIVLGYPLHMNGDKGLRADISIDFKNLIENIDSNIKVSLEDERLTTVMADNAMIEGNLRREKRKKKKDEMAAVIILQNYLDKKIFQGAN